MIVMTKKPQRSPSLLGDRIKQLLGVDTDHHHDEDDSPPRSRRGLFQSVSSTNLSQPHPPSSSLPPQIPRSFYLGDLDIPSKLRGSRSLHNSPAAHNCSITQKYDPRNHYHDNNNQRIYKSLSPSDSCPTPVSDSDRSDMTSHGHQCQYTGHGHHHITVPLTSELADTNNSNSARSRNESHLANCSR